MTTSIRFFPHLRRGVGAALRRVAERGVGVVHTVFDTWSFVHFHVGDGEDALPVGARDFPFVPVLVDPADQRDPLALRTQHRHGRFTLFFKIFHFFL